MNTNISELLAGLDRKGAHFASFTYTSKKTGEKARYVLILGAGTETLYRKDLTRLQRIARLLKAVKANPELQLAAAELIASREKSLDVGIGNREDYSNRDTYETIGIPGVKIHKVTGEVYVSGLLNRKDVIEEGEPQKPVKSKPKTVFKNRITKNLPSGKYRFFNLAGLASARMNGETLELE